MPSRRFAQLPNILTILRMGFALAFPWVEEPWRLPLLYFALVTEYLDGALARRLQVETQLGQMLDPIADKLFFVTVAVTFLLEGRLTWGEIFILGMRDIAVAWGVMGLLVARRGALIAWMKPGFFGKLSTAIQYGAFLNLFLAPRIYPWVLWLSAFSGVMAIIQYSVGFARRMREDRKLEAPKRKEAA